ncbi:glycosyltransferase, partial [Candidatus Bathyarchaeota archaeon]|nr:glycosyltransferase [Candidatus Bathyarchaeota archaeon]
MKKRIVVIAEYFPPRLGGDRRIFELMKRLSGRFDVHFVTLPPSYTLFIRRIDSYKKGESHFIYEGMTGNRLDLPEFMLRLWGKGFVLSFAFSLLYLILSTVKRVIQLKPDIVVINNTSVYTGLIGFVSSKLLRKKLLVEYNDLEAIYAIGLVRNRVSRSLLPVLGRLLVLVEDIIVKNGWRVTAITEFIENYARDRKTRTDIVVIPDGVDTSLFDQSKYDEQKVRLVYNISPQDILCVYAGRIEESAGARIILRTALQLEG